MRTRGRALALALVLACGCAKVAVQASLPERDANEVVAALLRAGLEAHKVSAPSAEGRFAVEVAAADAARAFDVLRAAGLPRPPASGFADLYAGDRLVPTASEERARLQAAWTGELARSVESIDGVLEARVHLSMPERDGFGDEAAAEPARASVLVRYATPVPPYDEAAVRRLVAGGVPGLVDANVAVIGVRRTPDAPQAPAALPMVLGVRVDPASAGTLKAMFGAMLGACLVLSAALVAVTMRRRRAEREKERGD